MEADITSQAVGLASNTDFSIWKLFIRADIIVKSVIIILIASSIYSWAIIIEKIKQNGLAKGGSLENAIVVDHNKILNPEGLRNKKEFVNHKILDCIGDLYTSGYRIVASITCSRGGHYLTNQLLRKIFQNKDNFSIIEIKEKSLPHSLINKTLLRSIA